jgi:Na+/proline symporter
VANGIVIFVITAYWNKNPTALKFIMGLVPIFCSIGAFLFTYLGKVLYSERLARLSTNSKNSKTKITIIKENS